MNRVGGAPSHVSIAASVASASMLPTSRHFGTTCHLAADITSHRDICPKHACGTHGSRDYASHQEAATKALPYPFALAKHFYAKNAEGEETDVCLFSPQTYHQMHGEYLEVYCNCVRMLLKTSTINIHIVREEHNFPIVFIPLYLGKQRRHWLLLCVLAYATPASMPLTFSMTMILKI